MIRNKILLKIIMMKMSNYRFLVFFIGVLLLSTISGQEIKNSEETFLGIGSGNRKIAKIQKSSISNTALLARTDGRP